VLSYARPYNIHFLVQSLLKCEYIGRVLVSNNNPRYSIRDWIAVDDARLSIIDQPRNTKQGVRIRFAHDLGGEFVALIDDDRFLYPAQCTRLFESLFAEPEVLHGIEGEVAIDHGHSNTVSEYPFDCGVVAQGTSRRVDHATGVYFASRKLIQRAIRLLDRLGIDRLDEFGNGEDIVLSRSGLGKPILHDVGPVLQCASSWAVGTATYTTFGARFYSERIALDRRIDQLLGDTDGTQRPP